MNSNPVTENNASSFINESVNKIDQQRLAGLQEFQQHQSFRNTILQQESTRLNSKYGSDHPLVQQMETRISMNDTLNAGFEQEISKAAMNDEPLRSASWRIRGKIFDSGGKPVQGYTVFPGDISGNWVPRTPISCTDETGYYSLTLDGNVIKKLKETSLYLSVCDKNKQLVYLGQDGYKPAGGTIEYKDILLGGAICTPPASSGKRNGIFGITFWKRKQ